MSSLAPAAALIVSDGSVDAAWIGSSLPLGTPYRTVELGHGSGRLLGALEESEPELLVLAAAVGEGLLELISTARERLPGSAIVVVDGGGLNGYMQRAFDLGADDLVAMPQSREALLFALEKAVARRRRAAAPHSLGRMICMVGPKGGTGKTLTATNLAVALAQQGARPVVVDVDLQFGDVGLALGLSPERTVYDLAAGNSLDDDRLDQALVEHESGAKALLAPLRPDQAGAVSPEFLGSLFPALRGLHDFVIVDTPPAFSPEVIAAIDAASDLCVVAMLDTLSLKDTKIGLETLELMGRDPEDVRLVLNRADSKVGIGESDVVRLLERRPDVLVPSDRAVPRALTSGVPIVLAEPRSGPARAFAQLADLYLDHEPPPQEHHRTLQAVLGRSDG